MKRTSNNIPSAEEIRNIMREEEVNREVVRKITRELSNSVERIEQFENGAIKIWHNEPNDEGENFYYDTPENFDKWDADGQRDYLSEIKFSQILLKALRGE